MYGLYGSDENAMKAANHELKGLNAYFWCQMKAICLPLMTILTYKGWRLICISVLPIGSKSIIYGSVDGGVTVHNSDTLLNLKMKKASSLLNLKPHFCGEREAKTVYSCVDLEGHQGSDGRQYLLDFARVAPPTPPTRPGENLYRLFRMEFVRQYHTPLSSDGFSRMGKDNQKINSAELVQAYEYLRNVTIPKFALSSQKKREENQVEAFDPHVITLDLHTSGINLRYIGLVRSQFSDRQYKNHYLRFAIYRTGKTFLNQLMREISNRTRNIESYGRSIAFFLNTFCGLRVRSLS